MIKNQKHILTLIKKNNYKNPKVGDYVRISKYKNIFAKGYVPTWSQEVFVIKKVKNTVLLIYLIEDLNEEEIIETFLRERVTKKIKNNL